MAGTVSGVFLRRFRTNTSSASARKWSVAQVFKSNFPDSLEGLRAHVSSSDYVAVSLRWTGSPAAPWHRVSRLDNLETAYSKAKHAAGKFQVLHFAVCPFEASHIYPESKNVLLKFGWGLQYLVNICGEILFEPFCSRCSFLERIRSRIKQWKNAFEDSSTRDNEPLLRSMRKLISGSEEYGSRPSMTIDVLEQFSEDLVPLIIPAKGAGAWAVRVILTSSKEDKNLLEQELQNLEHEQTKAFRGDCSFGEDTNIATALSFLNNQFFAPVDREVSPVTGSEGKIHGLNVVRICHLFAKLCSILRCAPKSSQSDSSSHQAGTLERFANIFRPWPSADPLDDRDISGPLWDFGVGRLQAAGYETYMKLCRLGLFEADLADAFDHNFADHDDYSEDYSMRKNHEIHSSSESMIYLEDLWFQTSPFGHVESIKRLTCTVRSEEKTQLTRETENDHIKRLEGSPSINLLPGTRLNGPPGAGEPLGRVRVGLKPLLLESDLSVAIVEKAVPCSGATGAGGCKFLFLNSDWSWDVFGLYTAFELNVGQRYILMAHKTPKSDIWELALRSHRLWESLAENIHDQGLNPQEVLGWKKTGSLLDGQTVEESALLERRVKQLSEAGVEAEFLSSRQLLSEEPALSVDKESEAALLPNDCQLDAHQTVAFVEEGNRQFASQGRYGEFYHDPVLSLLRSGKNGEVEAVLTSKSTFYCKKAIVIAAGCWSGSLTRGLDIRVDVPGHLLVLENFNLIGLNHGLMEVGYVSHQQMMQHSSVSASGLSNGEEMLSISMTATTGTMGNLILGKFNFVLWFN
ncbi:hypothetical protein NL676_022021 [Syzygium grande]|nr:hypothetical protein NL676_022021 [Syzygium grande]